MTIGDALVTIFGIIIVGIVVIICTPLGWVGLLILDAIFGK